MSGSEDSDDRPNMELAFSHSSDEDETATSRSLSLNCNLRGMNHLLIDILKYSFILLSEQKIENQKFLQNHLLCQTYVRQES